jgi:hypothetical protein
MKCRWATSCWPTSKAVQPASLDSSEVTENRSQPTASEKEPRSSGAARSWRQTVTELAFQFPPPYLESQRRASSAASRSSSRSARPTCLPPAWSAASSAGVTSQRVTGVVNADTAKPDPVRKSRRFTKLQNEVATRTASARSRGESNPTSASGVSASPIPISPSATGRPIETVERREGSADATRRSAEWDGPADRRLVRCGLRQRPQLPSTQRWDFSL